VYETSALDWWLAAPDGPETVKTGARDALDRAGMPVFPLPRPASWSGASNTVIFAATTGDASNVWELGLSPRTGKVTSEPRKLMAGANESGPSRASTGAIAFHNAEAQRTVWSSLFDLDRGLPKGGLDQVTRGGVRVYPALSNDGRYLLYASDQSDQTNIWKRDLEQGNETLVARLSLAKQTVVYPAFSPADGRIAFTVVHPDEHRLTYVNAPGGELEKVGDSWRTTGWSSNKKMLLTFDANPYQVGLFDLGTHQQLPLLRHPRYDLLYARFSPDNRWVVFLARVSANRGRIAIAPIDGPRPVPESAWITIAEEGIDEWPGWSTDGKTVYFTSRRDGHSCLWGQRIDPISHRPTGDAFSALHIHGRASYRRGGWSGAGGRIALILTEERGNIWLMSRPGS
jgi:Tol biopolymer transport system component